MFPFLFSRLRMTRVYLLHEVAELVVVQPFELPVEGPPQRVWLLQLRVDDSPELLVQLLHVLKLLYSKTAPALR